jgi:hypothetical protein
MGMWRRLVGAAMTVAMVSGGGLLAQSALEIPTGSAPSGRLATTANGQTIYVIDGPRKAIVSFDPTRPARRQDVVGPAAATEPDFIAIGYLAGDVVAVVCRRDDEWSLRSYRLEPARPVDAAVPLQEFSIGTASGSSQGVDIAVSHARGWLAITGLPPPLPPVLRAAVAGVRVGPLSDRSCPAPAAGLRPIAAAVSPADELVLMLRPEPADADAPPNDLLSFYNTTGRETLCLSSGIGATLGLDFDPRAGTLFAVGTGADGAQGVWRLDATIVAGRQAIRARLLSSLEQPRDLVYASPRAIIVMHGEKADIVTSIDPTASPPEEEP